MHHEIVSVCLDHLAAEVQGRGLGVMAATLDRRGAAVSSAVLRRVCAGGGVLCRLFAAHRVHLVCVLKVSCGICAKGVRVERWRF